MRKSNTRCEAARNKLNSMISDARARWIGLLGATAVAALAMAALLPSKWVPRTGLGWQVEHFLIYFATMIVLCIAWRRPYIVAVSLVAFSGLLEALQGLTPDRIPYPSDSIAALGGAAGAISAAVLIVLLICARQVRMDEAL